ncbi:hypothetical protein [Actinomadura rubrisoli]|uniref:hypothetical protein n=1 Tax=Actinomadura rubrisoli TaxID=2530368 RepID=UPI00140554E9|nr:hypothetical protein [Actinomadura rubrisoli]
MSTPKRARWTARTTLAAGTLTAALAAAGPAASAATASATQAGEIITCQEVAAELPTVFGRNCNTAARGPLSGFIIVDGRTQTLYRCATGWAEGGLWVRGQDCQLIGG